MNPEINEVPTATSEKPKALRQKLSVLLRDVPAEECCLVVSHFEQAVMRGVIKAVPLSGNYFNKVVILEDGHKKRLSLHDELVVMDADWERWLAEQRRESRYRVLAQVGAVTTTIERVKSGADDFERLLEIRRKRLKAEQKKEDKS